MNKVEELALAMTVLTIAKNDDVLRQAISEAISREIVKIRNAADKAFHIAYGQLTLPLNGVSYRHPRGR